MRILGGGRLLAIRRVLAPLMKRSLIGAWLLVFIPATRELSTAMFLYGPKTRTMSVMLMDMSEEGNFESLAALGFLLLASTLVIVGARLPPARARFHAAAGAAMTKLVLIGLGKNFGTVAGGAGRQPDVAAGRIRLAARPVRLRQDHDAAHDRRLHQADRRHDRDERRDAVVAQPRRARRKSAACR